MARSSRPINFLELISGFRRGAIIGAADKQLRDLVAAVRETGGNGEISVTLPFKMNKAGQLECTPKIKSTLPRPNIGTGVYYVTDENELMRDDPRQLDIEDELSGRRDAN